MKQGIPLLVIFVLIAFTGAYGQAEYGVSYRFERDTVAVKAGETFGNRLWVHNHTDSAVALVPDAGTADTVTTLIGLPPALRLGPGERRGYPLKYFADVHTFRRRIQPFRVALRAEVPGVAVQPDARFYGRLDEGGALRLTTEQPVYDFGPGTNQLQLMLTCTNTGMVPIDFRLQVTDLPEGLEFVGEQPLVSLPARGVRQVPLTVRKRNTGRRQTDFSLQLQGIDPMGNTLATIRIPIQALGSVNSFMNASPFGIAPTNAAALRLLSINEQHTVYQLHANGTVPLHSERQLQYRMNLDYYQQLEGFNLYDTYLDYTTERMGVKLGNIYEHIDYPMSGRGAKISYFPNDDAAMSVYALQNNYLLVNRVYDDIPGENILAANYDFRRNDLPGRLTYLHSRHGYYGITTHQFSAQLPLPLEANQQLVFEAGYSSERFDGAAHAEQAAAFGMDYRYQGNGIHVLSNNYLSTPYYTGIRRGILQSDTRVVRSVGNRQFSARVSVLDNRPQFQGRWNGGFIPFRNSVLIGEVGYGSTYGPWHLEVKPYVMGQQLTGAVAPQHDADGDRWASSSVRSQLNVSRTGAAYSFLLQADYGYTYRNTAAVPAEAFHSVRLSANLTSPIVGIIGFAQVNPYYLSDIYSITPGARYTLVSVGPHKRFSAFNGTFTGQLGATYNYYGFSRNHTYAATGNLRWGFADHWSVAADYFYTGSHLRAGGMGGSSVASAYYDTRQLRVSIEKRFAALGSRQGKKLSVMYFEDTNNNGLRDADEAPAPGVRVTVEGKSAYTDADGIALFRHVPPGNYRIDHATSGRSVAAPVPIVLNKNKTIEVPLVQMETLKGQLMAVGKSYAPTAPNLSGIRITAVNAEGRRYEALTDAAGHYLLFLPAGAYELAVEVDGLPLSVENNGQAITIAEQSAPHVHNFNFRDERKGVHIRRF